MTTREQQKLQRLNKALRVNLLKRQQQQHGQDKSAPPPPPPSEKPLDRKDAHVHSA